MISGCGYQAKGRMWKLVVLVLDHCLFFTLSYKEANVETRKFSYCKTGRHIHVSMHGHIFTKILFFFIDKCRLLSIEYFFSC